MSITTVSISADQAEIKVRRPLSNPKLNEYLILEIKDAHVWMTNAQAKQLSVDLDAILKEPQPAAAEPIASAQEAPAEKELVTERKEQG